MGLMKKLSTGFRRWPWHGGGPAAAPMDVVWQPSTPFGPGWQPYGIAGTTWAVSGEGDFTVASRAALTDLHLGSGGYGGSVDLTGASSLTALTVGNSITELDLSGCTGLLDLSVTYAYLTSLDITGLTNLASLVFSYNGAAELVYGAANTALQYLTISGSTLAVDLDLTVLTGLRSVQVENCAFTGMDLRNLTSLLWLTLNSTPVGIDALYLGGAFSLQSLHANYCSVGAISLPAAYNLTGVSLMGNFITTLDLFGLPNLSSLAAANNYLTAVYNLSYSNYLSYLNLSNNNLSSFSLSGASPQNLWLSGNSLPASDVNAIFNDLDDGVTYGGCANVAGGYNAPPTYLSYTARMNLLARNWMLGYNS